MCGKGECWFSTHSHRDNKSTKGGGRQRSHPAGLDDILGIPCAYRAGWLLPQLFCSFPLWRPSTPGRSLGAMTVMTWRCSPHPREVAPTHCSINIIRVPAQPCIRAASTQPTPSTLRCRTAHGLGELTFTQAVMCSLHCVESTLRSGVRCILWCA